MIQDQIITPCIRKCKLQNNICLGCGRTKKEITEWVSYSKEQKEKIMIDLYERKRKQTKELL